MITDVIVPALGRAKELSSLLAGIPRDGVRDVYVVDGDFDDDAVAAVVATGAKIVRGSKDGYGNACLHAIDFLQTLHVPPETVVFVDSDFAGPEAEVPPLFEQLLTPIAAGGADMVVGSRALGRKAKALTIPEKVGNHVAVALIRAIYGQRYTDLGLFRAVRFPALVAMSLNDNDGFTVEMHIKAAKTGLRVIEVPVRYRRRDLKTPAGQTIKESIDTSYNVLFTIFRHSTVR